MTSATLLLSLLATLSMGPTASATPAPTAAPDKTVSHTFEGKDFALGTLDASTQVYAGSVGGEGPSCDGTMGVAIATKKGPGPTSTATRGVCLHGQCACLSGYKGKSAGSGSTAPVDAVRSGLKGVKAAKKGDSLGSTSEVNAAMKAPDFQNRIYTQTTSNPRVQAILITTRVGERVVHLAGALYDAPDGRRHLAVAQVSKPEISVAGALALAAKPGFARTYAPMKSATKGSTGGSGVDFTQISGTEFRGRHTGVMVGMGQKDAYVGDEAQAKRGTPLRPRHRSVMIGMSNKDAYVGDGTQWSKGKKGIGRPRHSGVMVGMGMKDVYVGDEAQGIVGGDPLDNPALAAAITIGAL